MDKLILIPFVISAVMLLRHEPKAVFIKVFLPALTLFPIYFEAEIARGVPELYFWSAALIPIFAVWVLKGFKGYEYNGMDTIIFLYILVIFLTQWANSDYKVAQKILFNNTLAIFIPYLMVRSLIKDDADKVQLIKMMTTLGAGIALFNLYEFRMFTNVFDEYLRQIWPTSVVWDTGFVQMRAGFKRAMGPFGHPIIAGYFFSLMVPLAIWCHSQKHYRNKTIGRLTVFLNVLGVLVSISRAPILGTGLGLLIIFYGWSRNRKTIVTVTAVIFSILLLAALPRFMTYISVTRATAETPDQRNAAYRKEMIEAYAEVALERPIQGWGRFNIPKVRGMGSIDNEYLGIALQAGLIALGFYLLFLLGTMARLYKFARFKNHDDPAARLAWCLLAGWVSAVFSQGTVYSGGQTIQYLFMLAGLSQNLILGTNSFTNNNYEEREPEVERHDFVFTRII